MLRAPIDPSFAPLTEQDIEAQTDSGSFSRGRTYARQARIHDTVLRGDVIEALCDGSDYLPYVVHATLARQGEAGPNPKDFSCTCPRGGFCKHVVALLLTWIDEPARFAVRAAVRELLAKKSREELEALVGEMLRRYPDLESLLDVPLTPSGDVAANVSTIDAAAIRGQVQAAVAPLDPWAWDSSRYLSGNLDHLLQLGQRYVDAGQWANAQVVYANLADEIMEMLRQFGDEEGELTGVISACVAGLVSCLDAQADLSEEHRLSEEQRERLITTLYEIWHFDTFEIGGLDLAQAGPEAISRNATDAERAMVEEWLARELGGDWSRSMVTDFRVMLREHAGATDEEILALYREAELWDEVAHLLLQMDRVGEAIAVARRRIQQARALVGFADALAARGGEDVDRALTLIDDRLWENEGEDPYEDAILQDWLRVQYTAHGRGKEALEMSQRGFRHQPTLQAYLAVRDAARLAGQPEGTWEALRPELLARLRERNDWVTLVQIHLEEGNVRAALDAYAASSETARRGIGYTSYAGPTLVLDLAAAAETDYPDDAIRIYRELAEGRIGYRTRDNYRVAAEYLARMKGTLEHHGRAEEWREFIADLRVRYKTLRALQDELNQAGL